LRIGVSYFGNRILEHVLSDMHLLKTIGFDFVVHTYSENDFEFYEKTMHDIVDISKEQGLEVWLDPWGVGGFFGGEAYTAWVQRYPKICQIDSIFEKVPAACPNNGEFRKLIKTWIKSAAKSGADFVFWDEPHFYQHFSKGGVWCCRCPACVKKFKETYKEEFPMKKSSRIDFFKMESIRDFLEFATKEAEGEGLRNAVCLLPEADEGFLTNVASLPSLEVIGTDPYGVLFDKPLEAYVKEETRKIMRSAEKFGKRVQIWVQAFRVPTEKHDEIINAMDIPLEMGADSIAVWGYKACKYISSIACENADELWAMIEEWVMKNEDKAR
jgi:hypothetical protein